VPTYNIAFDDHRPDTLELPAALLAAGVYTLEVENDGSVEISGNRDGLLYLAEVLVRCALGEFVAGHHVHLPLDSRTSGPNLDARPELTINVALEMPRTARG
jgi:hypothetical protein